MRVNSLTQWYSQPLPVHTKDQADWLFTPGFFTPKLKLLGKYAMQVIEQGETMAQLPDAVALGIEEGTKIWFREVVMYIDDTPCILGRSMATITDMRNTWDQLTNHGNTAIGYILYSDTGINRSALECAQLQKCDPLEIVARKFDAKSKHLHARRSMFTKNSAKLLVSECFLGGFWEILSA